MKNFSIFTVVLLCCLSMLMWGCGKNDSAENESSPVPGAGAHLLPLGS